MGGIDYLRLDKTKDKSYAFDQAFDWSVPQKAVFEGTANAVVADVIRGGNACVFAYGATGSGKTYTMMGSDQNPGVVLLTVDEIFSRARAASEDFAVAVTMQYVEIYNERIQDLLNPENSDLDVRESKSLGTFVAGASSTAVSSRQELEALIYKGNLFRTTEATNVNEVSSRSHAVLQLRFELSPRFDEQQPGTRIGKLSMIDLAGSERAKKTDNAGKRLTEGANINRSLLALANCINALADKTKRMGHVPYRDSKLTRLLKDSLGGHCRTVMLVNVSPAHDQFDETLNSLKYANRAKNIRTKEVTVTVKRPTPAIEQLAMVRELRESFGHLGRPAGLIKAGLGNNTPTRGGMLPKRSSANARSDGRAATAPAPPLRSSNPIPLRGGHGGAAPSRPGTAGNRRNHQTPGPEQDGRTTAELQAPGLHADTPAEATARMNQSTAWAEAHAMLDRLEKDAVLELQLELAGLLAERMHLLDDRQNDGLRAYRARIRAAGSALGTFGLSHVDTCGGDATEDALDVNRRSLIRTRSAFLAGLPSDEHSEHAGIVWENAMLRAEVHAGLKALQQVQQQAEELAQTVTSERWNSNTSAPLISELSKRAAAFASEQSESIDKLSAWDGTMSSGDEDTSNTDSGAAAAAVAAANGAAASHAALSNLNKTGGGKARRFRYLAQLVPAMLRHSPQAFATMLKDCESLTSRHRAEREALCDALRIIPADAPDTSAGEATEAPAQKHLEAEDAKVQGVKTRAQRAAEQQQQQQQQVPNQDTSMEQPSAVPLRARKQKQVRREGSIEKLLRGINNISFGGSNKSRSQRAEFLPVAETVDSHQPSSPSFFRRLVGQGSGFGPQPPSPSPQPADRI